MRPFLAAMLALCVFGLTPAVAQKGPEANLVLTILGGTVHNISSESLHDVAVELQLRKRVGSGVESRVVIPESTELAPDAKARYSIQVATQDYISATFLGVVAGDNRADVPFKAFPGAARPPMDVPPSKIIIVQKPRPKNGEEFINTPNTPGRVP